MAWHDATCAKLDLEWEDSQPGCRRCVRKAPKLAPIHPISPPAPPPDTPRSQLICTWPPSLFSQAPSGHSGGSELLTCLLANIDEWAGTASPRPLRTALQSEQQSLLQQPLSRSGPGSLFQGIYSRLTDADSIRLLRLHGSGDTNYPICGTLEIHRLRDPCRPIFEAFSYTWADYKGDSSLCETIFLGPQYDVLPVTTNCSAALRRFRTVADRLIWVDAICINQFDLKERGHQVSLMRNIYTSAARVLTYLGKFDHVVDISLVLPQNNNQLCGETSPSSTFDSRVMLRTPYFSRIWVIQELMLSKTASVTLGDHTMHLDDLLSNINTLPFAAGSGLPTNWLQHFGQKGTTRDIFSLLVATKNCHCGDLRDRVYGLMGLVTDDEAEQLLIDYNISVQQLYTGLAMHWFASVERRLRPTPLEILKLALLPRTTPFLPSWAPDWAPQLYTDVILGCAPSASFTIHFDTTQVQRSSGLNWPGSMNPYPLGWMLDEHSWQRNQFDLAKSISASLSNSSRTPESLFPWHKLAKLAGWSPDVPIKLLPRSGALAIDAVHILSTSMGNVELTDIHGKLLHGLQVADLGELGLEKRSLQDHDIELCFLPSWGVAVALKKHSDTIYSLQGLSRIVSAPSYGPMPPSYESLMDIYKHMEVLESKIVEHWLMDSFYHGVCAGSAYGNTRIRGYWSRHFPLASIACQASDTAFNLLHGEVHHRSIIAAMMKIREEVLSFLAENRASTEVAFSDESYKKPGKRYTEYFDDKMLVARIKNAQATRQIAVSSAQEMCAYLWDIVEGHQNICKQYKPLQLALNDVQGEGPGRLRPFMWTVLKGPPSFSFPLLVNAETRDYLETIARSEGQVHPITQVSIVQRALELLSNLTINPKSTLEQNFNILWIYVLTMEMVARIRGVLQQRLVLKAIQDKMRYGRKIYIV